MNYGVEVEKRNGLIIGSILIILTTLCVWPNGLCMSAAACGRAYMRLTAISMLNTKYSFS